MTFKKIVVRVLAFIPLTLFIGIFILARVYLSFAMSDKDFAAYLKKKGQNATPSFVDYQVLGRNIHYVQIGEDTLPPVLFVHGSPGGANAFIDFLADTSLSKVCQLITYDRPGYGGSGYGEAEPSLERQAMMIKPLLERFAPRKVLLVGHSLGGPIVAKVAMDYPELVAGLVIVAGSIDASLEPKEWYRKPMSWRLVRWYFPGSFRASNDELLPLKPQLEAMEADWKKITCPVTVIQGDKDILVAPGNAAFAERMLVNSPKVDIQMIKGENHFVVWTKPALISDAVRKMVRE